MLSLHFYGGISNESLHFYEGKFVDLQLSSILSFVSLKNGVASATPFQTEDKVVLRTQFSKPFFFVPACF